MLHDTTMSIVDHSMMLLMGNVMLEHKRENYKKILEGSVVTIIRHCHHEYNARTTLCSVICLSTILFIVCT